MKRNIGTILDVAKVFVEDYENFYIDNKNGDGIDFAVISKEITSVHDAIAEVRRYGGWMGIHRVDTMFDSMSDMIVADYYGGHGAIMVELYQSHDTETKVNKIRKLISDCIEIHGESVDDVKLLYETTYN